MNRFEILDAVNNYSNPSLLALSFVFRSGLTADAVRAVRVLAGYVPDLRRKIIVEGREVWEPFAVFVFNCVMLDPFHGKPVDTADIERERDAALRGVNEGESDDFIRFCFLSRLVDSVEYAARMVARGECNKGSENKSYIRANHAK